MRALSSSIGVSLSFIIRTTQHYHPPLKCWYESINRVSHIDYQRCWSWSLHQLLYGLWSWCRVILGDCDLLFIEGEADGSPSCFSNVEEDCVVFEVVWAFVSFVPELGDGEEFCGFALVFVACDKVVTFCLMIGWWDIVSLRCISCCCLCLCCKCIWIERLLMVDEHIHIQVEIKLDDICEPFSLTLWDVSWEQRTHLAISPFVTSIWLAASRYSHIPSSSFRTRP